MFSFFPPLNPIPGSPPLLFPGKWKAHFNSRFLCFLPVGLVCIAGMPPFFFRRRGFDAFPVNPVRPSAPSFQHEPAPLVNPPPPPPTCHQPVPFLQAISPKHTPNRTKTPLNTIHSLSFNPPSPQRLRKKFLSCFFVFPWKFLLLLHRGE